MVAGSQKGLDSGERAMMERRWNREGGRVGEGRRRWIEVEIDKGTLRDRGERETD